MQWSVLKAGFEQSSMQHSLNTPNKHTSEWETQLIA